MKKLLTILLASIILVQASFVSIFGDDFVPSIGIKPNIEIVPDKEETRIEDNTKEETNDKYELIVTPYMYKDSIDFEESKKIIEKAYGKILDCNKITDLCPDIEPIAISMGVGPDSLVVRDLFDITAYEPGSTKPYERNANDEPYEFTLKVDSLKNFVCLIVYYDNAWHIVDDVEKIDNNTLKVITSELSPFALITATNLRYEGFAKGCIWHLYIIITLVITFVLTQLIQKKQDDGNSSYKKVILIRDIICIISLLLSIIFYIFGVCKYDIYALVADIIVVVIVFIYTHVKKKQ